MVLHIMVKESFRNDKFLSYDQKKIIFHFEVKCENEKYDNKNRP